MEINKKFINNWHFVTIWIFNGCWNWWLSDGLGESLVLLRQRSFNSYLNTRMPAPQQQQKSLIVLIICKEEFSKHSLDLTGLLSSLLAIDGQSLKIFVGGGGLWLSINNYLRTSAERGWNKFDFWSRSYLFLLLPLLSNSLSCCQRNME